MLSAQSTDKQVDEALPELFGHFQSVQAMAEAPAEEIEQYIRSVGLYKNKAKISKNAVSRSSVNMAERCRISWMRC